MRGAGGEPGVCALGLEGLSDALVDGLVAQDVMGSALDENADRHAPGALARDDPIGPVGDHAGDAVLARRRHPAGLLNGLQGEVAQGRVFVRAGRVEGPVHGDEPLRRVAEDDRLLRAPAMGILMLQAATGQNVASPRQRLDDGVVGVALGALVIEHALGAAL